MLGRISVCNVERVERRTHWRDRRSGSDRRNEQRLRVQLNEGRSDTPRRLGDYTGALTEGVVWWRSKNVAR